MIEMKLNRYKIFDTLTNQYITGIMGDREFELEFDTAREANDEIEELIKENPFFEGELILHRYNDKGEYEPIS